MNDCDNCKHQCGYFEWFPMGIITFCRPQTRWIIANLKTLREGIYPPNPSPNSYISPDVKIQPKQIAPFVKSIELFTEIDTRLTMLPQDARELLEESVESEKDISDFRNGAKKALTFVSGFLRPIAFCPDCNGVTYLKRKSSDVWTQICEDCNKTWGHLSFTRWKAERNYREKMRQQHICPGCGGFRWRTKVKGQIWVCRKCGYENIK